MIQQFQTMAPSLFAILLTITNLCSKMQNIRAEDTINPPYIIETHINGPLTTDNKIRLEPLDNNAIFEIPVNMLEIFWLNSSIHSISIKWALDPNYNLTGFVKDSVVEYFPKGGRFTSHPLSSDVREYTFDNLEAGTMYTLCVHMLEIYGEGNYSSINHSKCVKINTIDYIRRDSVVIMIITLGYYAFMGLIGYTQWKRRLMKIRNNTKNRYSEPPEERNENQNVCVMRWRDLAEKERLMSNPGRSIEGDTT